MSDHPDYPAWCDTSDSTWGYCGSVDDWYSSDATADNDADWMYTSGSVCPRGKVTTIATDDSFGPVPAAVVATMSQTGGKGMGGESSGHEHGSSVSKNHPSESTTTPATHPPLSSTSTVQRPSTTFTLTFTLALRHLHLHRHPHTTLPIIPSVSTYTLHPSSSHTVTLQPPPSATTSTDRPISFGITL